IGSDACAAKGDARVARKLRREIMPARISGRDRSENATYNRFMSRNLLILILAAGSLPAADAGSEESDSWNKASAAAYLDARATWWMGWPSAARDHETFCISCHTTLPYALSRAPLRESMGGQTPSEIERKLLDNVARRVNLWDEVQPFYSDAKNG